MAIALSDELQEHEERVQSEDVWTRTFCSRVQGYRSVGPIMTSKPIQSQFDFLDIQIEPGIFDGLDSGAVAVLIHVSF